MKRRFAIAQIALIASVFVVLAIYPWREPRYGGRSLSSWLEDLVGYNTEQQAAFAVKQMGTNAMPFLIPRLSQNESTSLKRKVWELLQRQSLIRVGPTRFTSPREQALAALNYLGPDGKAALPALEKLLHENPPDPTAPYVIARIGGVPVLVRALTNENRITRMEARVCLDLLKTHSEVLFPRHERGSKYPSFLRQQCEFNLQVLTAAYKEYAAAHPQRGPASPDNKPKPALPPDSHLPYTPSQRPK